MLRSLLPQIMHGFWRRRGQRRKKGKDLSGKVSLPMTMTSCLEIFWYCERRASKILPPRSRECPEQPKCINSSLHLQSCQQKCLQFLWRKQMWIRVAELMVGNLSLCGERPERGRIPFKRNASKNLNYLWNKLKYTAESRQVTKSIMLSSLQTIDHFHIHIGIPADWSIMHA